MGGEAKERDKRKEKLGKGRKKGRKGKKDAMGNNK